MEPRPQEVGEGRRIAFQEARRDRGLGRVEQRLPGPMALDLESSLKILTDTRTPDLPNGAHR